MSAPAYLKRGSVPLQDSGAAMANANPASAFGQPTNPYITFTASSPNGLQNAQPMPARKRIWVKRPGGNATTLFVGPGDLVDDVKSQIMLKFPTTLAQQFDPSELILKLEIPSVLSPSSSAFNTASGHPQRDSTFQNSPLAAQNSTYAPKTIMSRSSSTNLQGNKMSKMRPHAAVGENPSLHAHPVSPIPVSASKSSLLSHNEVSAADRVPEPTHKPSPVGHTRTHAKSRTTTIVLEPDAFIWKIVDQYFPSGMKVEDSFIIDTPYPVVEKRPSAKTTFPQAAETSSLSQAGAGGLVNPEAKDAANAPPFYSGSLSGRSNPTRTPQDAAFSDNNYSGKVAVLGEQSLPPPREFTRLGRNSVQDQNQSSSTVILFPKGTRTGSKSPASQYSNNAPTPGRTPTFEENHAADESNKASTTPESASSSSKHPIVLKHGPKKEEVASALRLKQQPKPGINKILNNINVLVVEDNLVNQKILARHLKSCNVQFRIASNGEEGLQLWKEGGFHLCFMDIQLPVISGIQVTEEIRRLERLNRIGNFANLSLPTEQEELKPADQLDHDLFRSPIIIVALTASTSAADKQQALAAGCNDYLTKPVQLKWLRNKLTEWGCMQALINYDHFRNGKD
ncbi:hypothetical protein KL944_003716 [Ogataea haglerorum]|nr:hypothetical protein KL944_003716 [Ogataea haglerorum]